MRTRLLVGLCAVVVGMCISCDNTIYRIEMTPHGDQMTRQLDMTRSGASSQPTTQPADTAATQPYQGAFPTEMVQHISGQYQQSRQVANNEVVFLGDFSNKLPDDVGNLGHFRVFEDPMGTASLYLEQFRGQSAQTRNALRVLESADTLADLITVYLRQNLSKDPAWPAFEQFLKKDFRDDMRNLALDLYIARAAGTITSDVEHFELGMDKWLMVRAWQFLVEHGYSTLDDMTAFKAMDSTDFAGPNILQTILGRKMGIPADEWKTRLAFMNNLDKVRDSFLACIESQDSYKKWQREKLSASQPASRPYIMEAAASKPSEDQLKQDTFLGELANVIMYAPTYPTPDALELTLSLPQKPVLTNGQWDTDTGKVKWNAAMPTGANLPLPVICFASWTEPSIDFQRRHFGRVVLQGEDLYDYIFWVKTLSPENAKQWQQFLSKLDSETVLKNLEGFRFRDDPKMTEAAPGQPATMPAGKATAWTQKIADLIRKGPQSFVIDRALE